jgi:abequosyltransferase
MSIAEDKMGYKLSICIPTYNRAQFLPELFDSILSQVDIENPVEICISDNGSDDNTQEIIQKYQRRYNHLIYFRWPSNMGFDRNLLKAIDIASGEYCWLMGSDDIIEKDAIAYILAKLNEHKNLVGMKVNGFGYDYEMKNKLPLKLLRRRDLDRDMLFDNAEKAFACLGVGFGYISSLIINKSIYAAVMKRDNLEKYYNGYVQLYIVGSMLKINPHWLYLSKKCVGWRSGNDAWINNSKAYERLRIDVVGYSSIVGDLFDEDHYVYRKVMSDVIRKYVFGRVIVSRAKGDLDFSKAFKLTLRYYWRLPAFWLLIVPAFLAPRFLLQGLLYLYRAGRKKLSVKQSIC